MTAQDAMRFAIWASTHRRPITWQQVADAFQCSRATAYRYIAAWEAAAGLQRLERFQQRDPARFERARDVFGRFARAA